LSPGEAGPGGSGVVVLSQGLGRRAFGADPSVVGRTVTLQGGAVTVVGVMPAGFAYPNAEIEMWKPMPLDRHQPRPRGNHSFSAVARLRPGTAFAQAAAEMDVLARQLQAANPDEYPAGSGFTIRLRPLRDQMRGP